MKPIIRSIFFAALLVIGGCGGGSEGTGTRSISGKVLLDDGSPLAQAIISIIETGDSTTSGDAGDFSLETDSALSTVNIMVEKNDIAASTQISGLDAATTEVKVQLTVTRGDASLVAVGYLEAWARIVGNCEEYFANDRIIKQTKQVPDNLRCTLRFFVSGDGKRLERIRGQIEVRTCQSSEWRKIAEGITGTGPSAGFGDIDFDYIDDTRNCVYRLITPINDPEGRSFEITIQTKTFQDRN